MSKWKEEYPGEIYSVARLYRQERNEALDLLERWQRDGYPYTETKALLDMRRVVEEKPKTVREQVEVAYADPNGNMSEYETADCLRNAIRILADAIDELRTKSGGTS